MLDTVNERSALLNPNTIRQYGCQDIIIQIDDNDCTSNPIKQTISISCSDFNCSSYPNYSVNADSLSSSENTFDRSFDRSRCRYYDSLGLPANPYNIISSEYIGILPHQVGTQSSLITIFVIWNTMMGTSLLSMPWAIQQSGFALGIILMLIVAGLAFYTAYLVIKSTENLPLEAGRTASTLDFTDACKFYLGRTGEIMSIVFSFIALLSGLVVYYVLLCNFLYFTVNYVHDFITGNIGKSLMVTNIHETYANICSSLPSQNNHNASYHNTIVINLTLLKPGLDLYNQLWSPTLTVPFWMLIIILPLISIKSPTFFAKFNALGTMSVIYLFFLVILNVSKWGINMNFHSIDNHFKIPNARDSFIVLTGVGSLAFFIHNAIHSIMRNQAKPRNNGRDLFIAYICVALTYLGIGILFYIAFPFPKICIQDNLLNNLSSNDIFVFIGRVALFFQVLTVFPLLMYILRTQFMFFFFNRFYPSWFHVSVLHVILLAICIIFAIFLPHIGEIARFSGAICGLMYIFALPALVKIQSMKQEGNLSFFSLLFHISLIGIGLLNFLGQFLSYFLIND